ncbi:MAG: hypothetical protein J6Q42_04760 [Clostridia bacterium]|nr:hypothetical protein [Clostridia bacterium]
MNPSVMQMQREAAARVQRMEEQSRRLVREHPVKIYRGTTVFPKPPQEPVPPCPEPIEEPFCEEPVCEEPIQHECPPPFVPQPTPKSGMLSWLAGDEERALLLLLAVILWQSGAPLELLLALVYVAL